MVKIYFSIVWIYKIEKYVKKELIGFFGLCLYLVVDIGRGLLWFLILFLCFFFVFCYYLFLKLCLMLDVMDLFFFDFGGVFFLFLGICFGKYIRGIEIIMVSNLKMMKLSYYVLI